MKCEICGTNNHQGTLYCSNCGHKLEKANNYTADKTAASIALGVISIILSAFMIPIAPLVTAILGLVFALQSKDNINVLGIILNIVALLIKLLYIIFFVFIFFLIFLIVSLSRDDYYEYEPYKPHETADTSEIEGTYFCKNVYEKDYSSIVTINSNKLRIEDFDNPKETYIVGSYTTIYDSIEEEYVLTFYVDEEYINGDKESEHDEVNIVIEADYDSMEMNYDNGSIYECDRIENGV